MAKDQLMRDAEGMEKGTARLPSSAAGWEAACTPQEDMAMRRAFRPTETKGPGEPQGSVPPTAVWGACSSFTADQGKAGSGPWMPRQSWTLIQ